MGQATVSGDNSAREKMPKEKDKSFEWLDFWKLRTMHVQLTITKFKQLCFPNFLSGLSLRFYFHPLFH